MVSCAGRDVEKEKAESLIWSINLSLCSNDLRAGKTSPSLLCPLVDLLTAWCW